MPQKCTQSAQNRRKWHFWGFWGVHFAQNPRNRQNVHSWRCFEPFWAILTKSPFWSKWGFVHSWTKKPVKMAVFAILTGFAKIDQKTRVLVDFGSTVYKAAENDDFEKPPLSCGGFQHPSLPGVLEIAIFVSAPGLQMSSTATKVYPLSPPLSKSYHD